MKLLHCLQMLLKVLHQLLWLFLFCHASGQVPDMELRHALSIEYSYLPGIFLYGNVLPDNMEYSYRTGNHVYIQTGLFAQNADEVPGSTFFKDGFAVYGGTAFKFPLFHRKRFPAGTAYFSPSIHLYADYFSENNRLYDWTFTIGPTAAVEYFFSSRFSCRLDLINLNFGIGIPYGDFVATVHRLFGLGVHYHFGLK